MKVVNGGEPPKPRKEFIDVVVTNMNDDGTFGVQIVGDSTLPNHPAITTISTFTFECTDLRRPCTG